MEAFKDPFVDVSLPAGTLRALGISETEAQVEVNRRLVLELYREGLVSLGRAAELAAMSTAEFLSFMGRHRAYLNYGEDELEEDRATTAKLAR